MPLSWPSPTIGRRCWVPCAPTWNPEPPDAACPGWRRGQRLTSRLARMHGMTTVDPTPRRLLPNLLRGFVLVVCLTFAGAEYWHGLETRAEARGQIELDAANLARSVGQHAEDSFLLA